MDDLVIASDGIPARLNGEYAEEKLDFVDRFLPPALNMTASKRERWYVDLFAGPGLNLDRSTRREFRGAALRALTARAQGQSGRSFTHAALLNLASCCRDALQERVSRARSEVRVPHVQVLAGDANREGVSLLERIGRTRPYAYTFVFADPTRTSELPWKTVERIARRAPESTDLYVLVPLDMGINRQISNDHSKQAPTVQSLTDYFGTDEWRSIAERSKTSALRQEMRYELLDLYCERLRAHWPDVIPVRDIRLSGNKRLYRMVFCTRFQKAAALVRRWERATYAPKGQLDLGFEVA